MGVLLETTLGLECFSTITSSLSLSIGLTEIFVLVVAVRSDCIHVSHVFFKLYTVINDEYIHIIYLNSIVSTKQRRSYVKTRSVGVLHISINVLKS